MRKTGKKLTIVLFVALLSMMTLAPILGFARALTDAYDVTISGLPTETMNRGEDVTFTVTVEICGDPVSGANITFNDPKGGKVDSGEIDNGDGTYSVTYTIADDDTVGTWYITANATKCTTYTGESSGLDTVEISATYTIYDIVSPVVGSTKNRGQTVDFDFKVKDASGDPVSGLTSLDLNGISVPIVEDDAGHYTGSYTILSTDAPGTYDGTVSKNGNTGTQSGWLIISDVLLVSVSTDKAVYQRTEIVVIMADVDYQDGSPVLGATVTATGRDGITTITLLDDGEGLDSTADDGIYTGSYKLKTDDAVGMWTIVVDAEKDGNAGSGSEDVEVTGAVLDVVFASLLPSSVERTEDLTVVFNIYYPDGVTELTSGTVTVKVYDGSDADVTGDFIVGVPAYSAGVWSVVIDTKIDTPSGSGYRVGISAVSTDLHDVAPEKKSNSFSVEGGLEEDGLFEVSVSLLDVVVISTESDYSTEKNIYGGLETVYFIAHISYPDASDFTDDDGTAFADIWIDANGNDAIDVGEFVVVTSLELSYKCLANEWRGSFDLYPPGAIQGVYKIKVSASDASDNSGSGTDLFNVVAQTIKDPTHGPVGTEVTETGSGFAPFSFVYVMYHIDNYADFVGVGDFYTTEFTLFPISLGSVVPDSETIYLNGIETSAYSIDYETGVVTFDSAPAYGDVITVNCQLHLYIGSTMTDEYGSFVYTLTVPESYAGEHMIICSDGLMNFAVDIFTVEPQIVLSSTKGPPEAWITVTGTGFAPNTPVYLDAVLAGIFWEESWAIAFTDAYGTFAKAIVMPILNLQILYMKGAPVSVAPIGIVAYDMAENTDLTFYVAFLLCEGGFIDVEVEVGDLYFPGEIMTVYALTSVDGAPADVDNIEFMLYYETAEPYTVELPIRVDQGLYAITTTLPPDIDLGNYLIEVKASTSTHYTWHLTHFDLWDEWWEEWLEWFVLRGLPTEWLEEWYQYGIDWWLEGGLKATISGVGIDGFTLSPTLLGMGAVIAKIDGTIATVVVPGMGQIQMNLALVNATLMGLNVQLQSINAKVTDIDGDLVTISTDLGELRGRIVSMRGDVATIETYLGTVKLALPQLATKTSLYMPIGVILSAFAAIAAVAACVLISRKIV